MRRVAVGFVLLMMPAASVDAEFTVFSVAQLREIESRVVATIERAGPAVVSIRRDAGNGSGVVVGDHGLVYSVSHVTGPPGERAAVFFPGGVVAASEAVASEGDADAGLMRLLGDRVWPSWPESPASNGRDPEPLSPGDFVVALGHPHGFDSDRPVVARLGRVVRVTGQAIQTDAPLIAGDSGGPLLDLSGHMVGVHTRIGVGSDENYHLPMARFAAGGRKSPQETTQRSVVPSLVGGNAELPTQERRDEVEFRLSFSGALFDALPSVVEITHGGAILALGTVVSERGDILANASALSRASAVADRQATGQRFRTPELRVRISDESFVARLIAMDRASGLAWLRVEGEPPGGWRPIAWEAADPGLGRWAISVGPEVEVGGVLAVGIVSASARRVPSRARLGVAFAPGSAEPMVRFVLPDSGAAAAGLRSGDIIRNINGVETHTSRAVVRAVSQLVRDERVAVEIERNGELLRVQIVLGLEPERPADRAERMQRTVGPVSARRSGFARAWSHDGVVSPDRCGGPVVMLGGEVVGINIARAGRTETLVLPVVEIEAAMQRMRATVRSEGD